MHKGMCNLCILRNVGHRQPPKYVCCFTMSMRYVLCWVHALFVYCICEWVAGVHSHTRPKTPSTMSTCRQPAPTRRLRTNRA